MRAKSGLVLPRSDSLPNHETREGKFTSGKSFPFAGDGKLGILVDYPYGCDVLHEPRRIPSDFQSNCQDPVRCVGPWISSPKREDGITTPPPFRSETGHLPNYRGQEGLQLQLLQPHRVPASSLCPVLEFNRRRLRGRLSGIDEHPSLRRFG